MKKDYYHRVIKTKRSRRDDRLLSENIDKLLISHVKNTIASSMKPWRAKYLLMSIKKIKYKKL